MAKPTNTTTRKKPIEQYDHKGKQRKNNSPVGLVDDRGIESLKILELA